VRLHWFAHSIGDISVPDLSSLIDKLDKTGYESVLFAYHNRLPDMFLKSARALQIGQSIKLMIALRSRAISPEYCSMMCASFNEIESGRLMLNILHGSPSEDEPEDGIIDYNNVFSSRESVVKHTEIFLKKLQEIPMFKLSNTQVVLSGASKESIKMGVKYADFSALDYENLMRDPNRYSEVDRLMVTFDLIISNENHKEISANFTYGTANLILTEEEGFLKFLQDLGRMGVTDIMISSPQESPHEERIHEFVKAHYSKILAI
jgi:hypothetical protein